MTARLLVGGPMDGQTLDILEPTHAYHRTRRLVSGVEDPDWFIKNLPEPQYETVYEWHERGWESPTVAAIREAVERFRAALGMRGLEQLRHRAEATRAMPSLAAYDALVTDLLAEAETRLAETAPIDRHETIDAGGTSAATEYHDRRAVRVASPNRAALGVPEGLAPMKVLGDARGVLERDGWTTGRARRAGDKRFWSDARTIVEAIEYVMPWDGETPRAVVALLCDRLGLATDDPWAALDAWNDVPERAFADVLAALADDERPAVDAACDREAEGLDWCGTHDAYITPGDTRCWEAPR